ncbi:MAG: 4a-hydroxytetrahydrobiopterin dehydratase [Acidimicrobiales bacterium]
MSDRRRLEDAEIEAMLAGHPRWQLDGGRLRRTYEFSDFAAAFAFMTRVALVSERLDHHPEWSNVYDRLEIAITDHQVGALSTFDREWVEQVDRLGS